MCELSKAEFERDSQVQQHYSHIDRLLPEQNANSLRAKDGNFILDITKGDTTMSATVVAIQQSNERQEAVDLIRGVLGLYSDIYPGDERLQMSTDVLDALAESSIDADGPVVAHALEVTLAAWNEAGMDYHLGGHPQYMTAAWVCGAIMYAFQPNLRLTDVQAAVHMAEFGADHHA